MNKLLLCLSLGILIGASITAAIGYLWMGNAQVTARSTTETALDQLIAEWTEDSRHGMVLRSGAPYRVELTDAKPGYFPPTVQTLACSVESQFKIPKGVVLAQWALESRWGMSALGASNYFGHTFLAVKRFMPDPHYVLVREKVMRAGSMVWGDTVRFARYRNIAECFNVHGQYVSQSGTYVSAFKTKSPEAFARELAKRYATDPSYGIKLIVIMRRYGL
jgi:hypothetical protein